MQPPYTTNDHSTRFWAQCRADVELFKIKKLGTRENEITTLREQKHSELLRGANPERIFLQMPEWIDNITHVKANPSVPARKKLIEDFFVKGDPKLASDTLNRIREKESETFIGWINTTENNCDNIYETFVRWTSCASAMGKKGKASDQLRAEVVVGDIGSGKTFFQNYFVCKFSEEMDASKVILVRINLTREVHFKTSTISSSGLNMQAWIEAQITKVVARYYDRSSTYYTKTVDPTIDVRKILAGYLNPPGNRQTHPLQWEIATQTDAMIMRLQGNAVDSEISPDWIPPAPAARITKALQELGYRFIVIFDGLDQLGSTKNSRTKFESLLHATLKIAFAETEPSFFSVFFVRPATLGKIAEHFRANVQKLPFEFSRIKKSAIAPIEVWT